MSETTALDSELALPVGEPVPVPGLLGLVGAAVSPLKHRTAVAKACLSLTTELWRVGLGRSELLPNQRDWRFQDPTWGTNPLYRRLAQSYLAFCGAVDSLLVDMEKSVKWSDAERARFALGIVTSALAPTNTLLGNPAALKKTLETGGANLRDGLGNLATDVRHNRGMPAMAKPGALKVGVDMALSPGKVIHRDEYAEIIQYSPTTKTVYSRPVLIVPPPIGRYYFLDLRPGRSFVEHAVSRGLQTFIISWRNPGPQQADWDLDDYVRRIVATLDIVREVTGSDDVNTIGFCAGGILNTLALNYLATQDEKRTHSAAYAVTLLDFDQPAPIGAFSAPKLLSMARKSSRRGGIIDAKSMGAVFSWMRPNELVWNYWVNNYLLGQEPPVFDLLAWNVDGTNLPAELHHQFLDIFENNPLQEVGRLSVLGAPVDLGRIDVPTYVVGAASDHLTPWKGTYRTTQLLSGPSTYVLSNSGHVASLVNPPGNEKASYYTGLHDPAQSPEEWLESADRQTGSWWENWAEWTISNSGERKRAPRSLGSEAYPALDDAPGSYVHERP
jgi:polyhydroxyalkanoate synthase